MPYTNEPAEKTQEGKTMYDNGPEPIMRKFLPVAGILALTSISTFGQGRGAAPPPPPMPAVLQNYQPVTPARLKNPDPGDWLMIRRTYDG